jgi:hypothetical protein
MYANVGQILGPNLALLTGEVSSSNCRFQKAKESCRSWRALRAGAWVRPTLRSERDCYRARPGAHLSSLSFKRQPLGVKPPKRRAQA